MSAGTVKWFDQKKGYGFILGEDGQDIFVHYANIAGDGFKTLAEGDAVTFDVVESEKGFRAENVAHASADQAGSPSQEDSETQKDSETD